MADGVVYGCTLAAGHEGPHMDDRAPGKPDATWSTGGAGGRVISRHDCDLCGSDHFGIQCVACGWFSFDYYPGCDFKCRCGADVTPTVEQVSRWNVYEFDEEIDVKGNPE